MPPAVARAQAAVTDGSMGMLVDDIEWVKFTDDSRTTRSNRKASSRHREMNTRGIGAWFEPGYNAFPPLRSTLHVHAATHMDMDMESMDMGHGTKVNAHSSRMRVIGLRTPRRHTSRGRISPLVGDAPLVAACSSSLPGGSQRRSSAASVRSPACSKPSRDRCVTPPESACAGAMRTATTSGRSAAGE